MSDVPASTLPDDDMKATLRALVRAGQAARDLARQTGTAVVVIRDGVLVEERADESASTPTATLASSRP